MQAHNVVVKRCHGIGNVLMLLPVLAHLSKEANVTLITRSEWVDALRVLMPDIRVSAEGDGDHIDLDVATADLSPTEHRTYEFARLLGVGMDGFDADVKLTVPQSWRAPYMAHLGMLGFGPEAGHAARQWPMSHILEFLKALGPEEVVLLGINRFFDYPCVRADLRGEQSLQSLFGLVSVLRAVITLDSGLLHVAACIGVPAIALFGGIDPNFRILTGQAVRVLRVGLSCSPCNKHERCDGVYSCMSLLNADFVFDQVSKPLPDRRELVTVAAK